MGTVDGTVVASMLGSTSMSLELHQERCPACYLANLRAYLSKLRDITLGYQLERKSLRCCTIFPMDAREKEKQRRLSPAEQRRFDRFEAISAQLAEQGYRRVELTIGLVKANVVTIIVAIPFMIVCILAFSAANPDASYGVTMPEFIGLVVAYAAGIVIHEFIHGLTWSRFTDRGLGDVEFGFIKQYLTPYCTCCKPLSKGSYITGALMPGIVLGIIPTVVAICIGSIWLLYFGMIMAISAGGDVMIVAKLLRYKTTAGEVLFYDHPTQGGGVVFER